MMSIKQNAQGFAIIQHATFIHFDILLFVLIKKTTLNAPARSSNKRCLLAWGFKAPYQKSWLYFKLVNERGNQALNKVLP